jgi:hypothetical protein
VIFKDRAAVPPGEKLHTSSGGLCSRPGDCVQKEFCKLAQFIIGPPIAQSQHTPFKGFGKALYGRTERWLTHTDFDLRIHNLTVFVGEALRLGLTSEHNIIDAVKDKTTEDIYLLLLAIGHRLNLAGSRLDGMLKELDTCCDRSTYSKKRSDIPESFKKHREWMTVSVSRFAKISVYHAEIPCRKY